MIGEFKEPCLKKGDKLFSLISDWQMCTSWTARAKNDITETHFLAVRLAEVWALQWQWAADRSVHSTPAWAGGVAAGNWGVLSI